MKKSEQLMQARYICMYFHIYIADKKEIENS